MMTMMTMTKSIKKVQNFPILIFILVSQKQFYIYQAKHVFLKIHNGRGESCPPKLLQKILVGLQAHHTLNCLPKVDGLFIVTYWPASLGFWNA
jgi:hypothetical protein